MEFYRCAIPALFYASSCCPDVDYRYGAGRWLDFYVSGRKQWGIELLRNDIDLHRHHERNDNVYANISMKAFVSLNFVELHSGTVVDKLKFHDPALRKNETRVYWTPKNENTTVAILRSNQSLKNANFARPANGASRMILDI